VLAIASNYESGPRRRCLVGQVHNTGNLFSKKRKLDNICQSVIAEIKTKKLQLPYKTASVEKTS
jgi:hypothetical protein